MHPASTDQGLGAGKGPGRQPLGQLDMASQLFTSSASIRGYPLFHPSEQELEGAGNKTGRASGQRESPVSLPVLLTGRRAGTLADSTWVGLEQEGMKVSAEKSPV